MPDSLPENRRVRRMRLLASAGLGDLLEAEFALLSADEEGDPWRDFLLARLARRFGLHQAALTAASRFADARAARAASERPVEVTRLVFPPAFLDLAEDAARGTEIDPRLLLAVAREESWFDPDAVSAAGAIGLCQFMPGTGRSTALRLGERDFTAWSLRDPAVSLRFAAAYLSSLLSEFDGSLVLSAAAYNGGEGNARAWSAFHASEDVPGSIEAISFTETRGYVKKILRSLWIYKRAYPAEGDDSPRLAP
jgi:soluble lytic murein transglycosylase